MEKEEGRDRGGEIGRGEEGRQRRRGRERGEE